MTEWAEQWKGYDDREVVKDFFERREVIVGFSTNSPGLIAVGKPWELDSLGTIFVHLKVEDLKRIIERAEKHWGEKDDRD